MVFSKPSQQAANPLEEPFVNVWLGKDNDAEDSQKEPKNFYGSWVNAASAPHSHQPTHAADILLRLYPNHSIVMTQDYNLNVLDFPDVSATPMKNTPLLTNLFFIPLSRTLSPIPGILVDKVQLGAFDAIWKEYEFKLFILTYPFGFGTITQSFILHEGPEDRSRLLLLSVGTWADQLHEEIWVFNQGFWQKDHGLWQEMQKADWKDVILKDAFKKALQKDVYGFFASEEVYKQLAIPWKRGLIMYGPPGNGKTISLKTIMKTCGADGYAPLYVKSFQSYKGEEGAMADVFSKARQLAPCVVILEDLDSLINDRNRSFFLNQLDGLESNNGLLIIATTNHFDRLDPGLSSRPSRFDRNYLFKDPDYDERVLYVQYWQNKLKPNKNIDFPDELVEEVAKITDKFSFAYLKEAFVSTLVILAGYEGDDKPLFAIVLKQQIKILRHGTGKEHDSVQRVAVGFAQQGYWKENRANAQLDSLSDSPLATDQHGRYAFPLERHHRQKDGQPGRDFHTLANTLSNLTPPEFHLPRVYDAPSQDNNTTEYDGRIRALLDRISNLREGPEMRRFFQQAPTQSGLQTMGTSGTSASIVGERGRGTA